jgi:hypothetical protein
MDGHRFDDLTRALVDGRTRRGFLAGLAALAAGLAGARVAAATCPPGRVVRRGVGCVCRSTGRPPVGGVCPCPRGQTDIGDGLGCLQCRSAAECPPPLDTCGEAVCVDGVCGVKKTCDSDPDCCGCLPTVDSGNHCLAFQIACTAELCTDFVECTATDQCPDDYFCARDPLAGSALLCPVLCFPRCGVPFVPTAGAAAFSAASATETRRG